MSYLRSLLLIGAALVAVFWPQSSFAACGGARCICPDMRAFDPLATDPADFDRLDFGYSVHDLDVGLVNFIAELQNWAGAGSSAVARAARELRAEVQTLKDCFCGIPSHPFLMRALRGLAPFFDELQDRYAADMQINRNSHLQARMRRIVAAYEVLVGG
jgi:hypothetical protein